MTRPERGVIRDSLAHPAAIVAVGMFLIPMLTGFAGRALGQRLGYDMGQPFAFAALSTVMTAAQGVALTALTIWRVAGSHGLRLPLDALGLTARHWRREVAVGLRWGVALLAVNVVTSQLARRLYRLFMSEEAFQAQAAREGGQFVELVASGMPAWLIVSFAVVSVLVAPLAEELFFRGYLHAVLRARVPDHAVFVSSMLFAVLHLYVIHLVPIFVVGVLLALLYQRRGSLTAPVTAHAFSNLIVTVSMIVQGLSAAG